MPDATTSEGDTSPTKVMPADWAATTRVATAVGMAAPTHCAKKAATPAPVSQARTRPTTVAVRKFEQDDERPPADEPGGAGRERPTGDGDEPAAVRVGRRDDRVEAHPRLVDRDGVLRQVDDEPPEALETRVVLDAEAHDAHHRDRVGVRATVVGDGDRRVRDVDVDRA